MPFAGRGTTHASSDNAIGTPKRECACVWTLVSSLSVGHAWLQPPLPPPPWWRALEDDAPCRLLPHWWVQVCLLDARHGPPPGPSCLSSSTGANAVWAASNHGSSLCLSSLDMSYRCIIMCPQSLDTSYGCTIMRHQSLCLPYALFHALVNSCRRMH
jgi:hypothetical protein